MTLSGLPSRETSAGELDNQAFLIALDGVTRHGLSEAVKFILKGALGHPFMPSPPELRMQCDKAMKWHEDEAAKIRRREQAMAERPPVRVPPTDEQKARVRQVMQRFNRSIGRDAEGEEADFRTRMEAKYGRDALDAIGDAPDRVPGFRKVGDAS